MSSVAMPLSRRSQVLPLSSLTQKPPLCTPAKIVPDAGSMATDAMCLPSSMRRDSPHWAPGPDRVSETMPFAVATRTSFDGVDDSYRFLPFGEMLTVMRRLLLLALTH